MANDEVYKLFERLMRLVENSLSEAQFAEIKTLYEVNELGLAFEAVLDAFHSHQGRPATEITQVMTRLAELMDLPYEEGPDNGICGSGKL